jgi:hypothetical protein
MVVLLTGMELGLGPAQALRSIHVVEGKPTLSAQLMVALCKSRRDVCAYFTCVETTNDVATYETQRVGEPRAVRMSFSMEDAKRAGVAGKGNWQKFPAAMLRARCSSLLARDCYPDLLSNLYDPDELEPARHPDTPPAVAAAHAHADAMVAAVEAAEADVAEPLQYVLDDLAAVGWTGADDDMPITTDEAVAIWRAHKHRFTVETCAKPWKLLVKAANASTNALRARVREADKAAAAPPVAPANDAPAAPEAE